MMNKERIIEILKSFGVSVESVIENVGSTLTLYEVKPSLGVRISKIRNLKDEIAVGVGVSGVRVIAPMPNGSVGIEVPNTKREILYAEEILQSDEYENSNCDLPLAIGKDITGHIFIADLAEMPHLLIAGATGQGKSVGLNQMLISLLRKKSPKELQMVLIDPKKVELSVYSSLDGSYLAYPIVTETDEAERVLLSLCSLMDERYSLLSSSSVRNIKDYNQKNPTRKMPYIVVVIDEYGDLVMSGGKEMERAICRLAQKARAVGIHLIVSTQRPSATIVTGNIKANFPTRLAFRTTTGTDSRVVLDQVGAEKLTGKGDFLFFSGADIVRAQCALATLDDVERTISDVTSKYADVKHESLFTEQKIGLQEEPLLQLEGIARYLALKCTKVHYSYLPMWVSNKEEAPLMWKQLHDLGVLHPIDDSCSVVALRDKEEISRRIEDWYTQNESL